MVPSGCHDLYESRSTIAINPILSTSPVSAGRGTNNGLAILYMLLGMALFSAVDTQAKYLTQTMHPIQIVWFRQLGLFVGVLYMLASEGISVLDTKNRKLQVTRGILAASSATIFIIAVTYVPLADAVAISFVAPFLVTVLGAWFLGEKVGLRRWTAVAIGFVGTLIVIRPGFGVVHPAASLVLVAAAFFALRQILSRYLSGSDRIRTTVAYTALVSVAMLSLPLPFVFKMPETGLEMALLAGMAILAALAETCVIKALEIGESVAVAPVHYSLLIWGTMFGWLVFGQLPDGWTLFGALIIVATGIYTIRREWLLARTSRRQ
jgi:S-adenosylmethionine uptake transporter